MWALLRPLPCCRPSYPLDGAHHSPAETLPGCPVLPNLHVPGGGGHRTGLGPSVSPPITPLSDNTKQPVNP